MSPSIPLMFVVWWLQALPDPTAIWSGLRSMPRQNRWFRSHFTIRIIALSVQCSGWLPLPNRLRRFPRNMAGRAAGEAAAAVEVAGEAAVVMVAVEPVAVEPAVVEAVAVEP